METLVSRTPKVDGNSLTKGATMAVQHNGICKRDADRGGYSWVAQPGTQPALTAKKNEARARQRLTPNEGICVSI
ncbi:hypothetical protein V6N11_063434 [Hibiscus sabdariffa]|uniref:Uncharacterized protein n=1 Tax=Hibiscus sabdariffa TaxID=183260 RepID=A0ABR1ZCR3_9ROSI